MNEHESMSPQYHQFSKQRSSSYKWHRRLLVYRPTLREEFNDTADAVDGDTKKILYYTTYFG